MLIVRILAFRPSYAEYEAEVRMSGYEVLTNPKQAKILFCFSCVHIHEK